MRRIFERMFNQKCRIVVLFLEIMSVNIFLVIRWKAVKISTVCFVIAPCILLKTVVEIIDLRIQV